MKVEVNRAFKSYSFFQLRKKHKKDRLWINFCSISNTSVRKCLNRYFKINFPFICCPLLIEVHLNPQVRINIVLTTNLGLQDSPQGCIFSYFYKLLVVLALSSLFAEFSLKPIYPNIPPYLWKHFQFIISRLLENAFVNHKIEILWFF